MLVSWTKHLLPEKNHITLLEEGKITSFTLHPSDVGLPVYKNEEIRGGDAKENAVILLDVLNGKTGAYRDTVLLNAGLGLYANGAATSIQDGVAKAKESIDSGGALEKMQRLVTYSNKIASEKIGRAHV